MTPSGQAGSPVVSVIMPCYDHGDYLDEAMASVQAQSFQDFEILVIDDGSSEAGTLQLLAELRRPKTRVIRLEHGGVTRARNVGIRQALGRYLTFFDADDRMQPDFLERTVARLEAEPDLAFASTWVRLFGDEAWDWKPEHCDFPWLLHDCSVATAALVRREVVLEVGGFDEKFELGHEDWELWISIVERGYAGTIIPEVLFLYRRAGESRSTVADRGATYLELYRDRLRKHQAAYQRHLFDVLWLKESVIEPHLVNLPELRGDVEERLAPGVSRARAAVEAALGERIGERR